MTTVRTLIQLPKTVARGGVVEARATIAHPMETGHRNDAEGRRLPRNILTRFECRQGGELLFAADLFPAVAANPMLGFSFVATVSGDIRFSWQGDHGFAHAETVRLTVT